MFSKVIGLFCEDFAQEQYLQNLVSRILSEKGISCEFRPFVSRGGRPAVLGELRAFFKLQNKGVGAPDVIVVGNDGNCQGYVGRRDEVMRIVPEEWRDRVVPAIPDPHVEAWFFRDLPAFHEAVGPCDAPPVQKCDKSFYKSLLEQNTIKAQGFATIGGVENAAAIVAAQNLQRLKASGTDLDRLITSIEHT